MAGLQVQSLGSSYRSVSSTARYPVLRARRRRAARTWWDTPDGLAGYKRRYPSQRRKPRRSAEQADGDAGLDEHCPVDVGAQFGQAGLELLGRDVVAVLGGLADGVSDGVGLGRRRIGVGQGARDRVPVETRAMVKERAR